MAAYVYDGEALLDEQSELLSSSTPFDISYVAFLRTKLSGQQKLTMQRNQADHRAASTSPTHTDTAFHSTDRVRASLELQSPDPHARRTSYTSDRLMDSPGGGPYRPFVSGGEAFSTYGSQGSGGRRGTGGSTSGHRHSTANWEDSETFGPLAGATPMTFDDVPASASARLELASVTNMGDSLTTPESYVRESRARSLTNTTASADAWGAAGASLDERAAMATGRPVVPDVAEQPTGADDESALAPCPHCGRTFAPDRVDRHAELCAKQRAREAKKPKVDVIKSKRMMDLYEGEAVKPASSFPAPAGGKDADSLNTTWRRQSAQLRTAMGGSPGAPGMYPVEDDRVQCPGCGRRFAKDVADRHVPYCTTKATR